VWSPDVEEETDKCYLLRNPCVVEGGESRKPGTAEKKCKKPQTKTFVKSEKEKNGKGYEKGKC